MTGDELDALLIEDNPGDARLIEEMLKDAGKLTQRVEQQGEGGAVTRGRGTLKLSHEEQLSSGLDRLAETDVDVVLLDLGLSESTGLDTLDRVTEATEFASIIVLTGLDDEQIGLEAIQRGAQDYLVKGEVTSDMLVRSIHHAIERNRQERERIRQLEQLEALNRLNRISQDITHDVITTSTRSDLERAVCERLVKSDAYRFAWIGEVDTGADRITPREVAGREDGYLDEVTVPLDDEDARGPAARAVRTHEVQVTQDIRTDPAFERWREEATGREYLSGASIPIVHEDFLYGVLNVYSTTPRAFSEREVEILSGLGYVVGHAITAIERKDALVNDTVLELEFQATDVFEELVELSTGDGATIEIENLVHGNDDLLAYGRAVEVSEAAFRDAAAGTSEIDNAIVLAGGPDECEFEIATSTITSLADAVATRGGQIASATIAAGEFRFVVEFPPEQDRRQLVDLVRTECTGASLLAQRLGERTDRDLSTAQTVLADRLTPKQRTAIEAAYYGGYYDWPRMSSGQDLADRLGVAPATFAEHLRAAERKFFEAVFEES